LWNIISFIKLGLFLIAKYYPFPFYGHKTPMRAILGDSVDSPVLFVELRPPNYMLYVADAIQLRWGRAGKMIQNRRFLRPYA
jgi:hypothetical protein